MIGKCISFASFFLNLSIMVLMINTIQPGDKMTESSGVFFKEKENNFFSPLVEFNEISHLSMSKRDLVYDRKRKLYLEIK